jgi:hypothetical protein
MTTNKVTILLINNGIGIMRIGKTYEHAYDNMKHLAEDYSAYLSGDDPKGWDGNEIGNSDFDVQAASEHNLMIEDVKNIDVLFGRNAEELDFYINGEQ